VTWYRNWKLQLIERALEEHRSLLGAVEALADKPMLDLYDDVLGVLSGPRTLRIRKAPSLSAALQLHGAKRSFARALYHQQKLADLRI